MGWLRSDLERILKWLRRLFHRQPVAAATVGCIDFSSMAVGPQSNPWSPSGTGGATATFTTYNPPGSGLPPTAGNNEVRVRAGSTGLDCNFQLEIDFPSASQLTFRVLHQSQPPTITAFDSAGATVGSATAPPAQNVVSTLNIAASGMVRADVRSPADECILLEFCAT